MPPTRHEQSTPITDEADRQLVAYLAASGIAPSKSIRAWWTSLSPDQRRALPFDGPPSLRQSDRSLFSERSSKVEVYRSAVSD